MVVLCVTDERGDSVSRELGWDGLFVGAGVGEVI